jgi:sulfate permease, SulP family
MREIFPFTQWLATYSRDDAASDFVAAIIVTIMLVPQSLAYAMLAGLPPEAGLYASMLPLVAYAIFGSSRTLAVGPVAITSLMTAAAAGKIAAAGSSAYIEAVLALAAMSGLVLLAMSILRLGFIANLLSHPVISGFISASAVLIAASQLKYILGIQAGGDTLLKLVPSLVDHITATNLYSLVLGSTALAFLLWARSGLMPLLHRLGLAPFFASLAAKAGPLAAVLLSIGAVSFFALDEKGVKIVGAIPASLPPFTLPSFDAAIWLQLFPAAILLSLVGFVESVSVAQTLAARRRERVEPNQELTALGAANITAAMSGGMPVTGGFSRSVVNFDAGARTPLAGVFTALGILLAGLYLTPLFSLLPQAVLGATIIAAVLGLIDLAAIKRVWVYSKADFTAMGATILIVLVEGVEAGILAGVGLSLVLFIWRTSRPHMAIVGQVPGTEHFRNIKRHAVITDPDILSVRVDESLYFVNAHYLEDAIYDMAIAQGTVKHVVLMCTAVNMMDSSALVSLESLGQRLKSAGITFHLSEVKGPVMDALKRSDFFAHFEGKVFLSQFEAIQSLSPKAKGAD